MKDLARRLVVPRTPRLPGVDADKRALIAHQQDDVRKVRIDPEILIIISAGRAAQAGPRFAAVGRAHRHDAGAVDNVRIFGIHPGHRQIAPANSQRRPRIRRDARPVFSGIIRTVNPHAWLVRGHRSVQPARLACGNRYVHLNDAFR